MPADSSTPPPALPPPPPVPMLGATSSPSRVLSPLDATCVVIGAIIGVGIFFTPTRVAELAGSGALAMVAWGVGGAVAICGALTFAELGARFNAAGAQYEVIRDSWGSLIGFLFVFCISTVIVPGAAAIMAIICARNIVEALGLDLSRFDTSGLERMAASVGWDADPGAFGAIPLLVLSAMLVIGLMLANHAGARFGAWIQNVTVFAKVTTLLAVTGLAMFWGGSAPEVEATAAIAEAAGRGNEAGTILTLTGAVLAALVPAFFAYGGWQQALWVSGEVRDPRRTLPLSIIVGTVIVIVVYLLVNWAYFALLGYEGVRTSDTLASDAVGTIAPQWGARLVAAAVAVSSFGILNVQFLTGPRLTYALAKDGFFFGMFAKLSPRFGTPTAAITLLAIATLILLFAAGERGVDRLLTGVMFVDAVFFVLTGMALFVLRRRARRAQSGEPDTGFRVPLYPWIPLFFVVGEVGVVVGAYLDRDTRIASLIGAIWIGAGVLLYGAMWVWRERGS